MRRDSKTINQKIDFEKAPVCRKESIVQGAKYRISILGKKTITPPTPPIIPSTTTITI